MTSRPRLREKAQVLDDAALDRALTRIAHEILERNGGAKDLAFVGLRTRGVTLAQRLNAKIASIDGAQLPVGTLDITLYRDDLDMRGAPVIRGTDIPFSIKNKTVVLADDPRRARRPDRPGPAAVDPARDPDRPRAPRAAHPPGLHRQEPPDVAPRECRGAAQGARRRGPGGHRRAGGGLTWGGPARTS